MPTDQSNRVWSSWPWRDRENGRAREQSWILARRNVFFSPFHHLRSFDRSIPRKNVYLFAAHFSLDRVTLSSTKETETEKSIGFVRKLRRDCEIFLDSPEMWAPLMALVGFNVNNSLLKRIRQPCLVEARIGPREFHSKDVDREREREKGCAHRVWGYKEILIEIQPLVLRQITHTGPITRQSDVNFQSGILPTYVFKDFVSTVPRVIIRCSNYISSQFESVIGVRDSRTKSSLPISEKFLVLGK